MRFNNKELAHLASEPSSKFDKEGRIWMKDKQDGLFKKGDVYSERWCRLRGNLLFYFKGREAIGEPLGLLVLERCAVELDLAEERLNSFIIVFEGEDKVQHFAAQSERDRDAWIQALHIASYECLKMQVQSLREQIRAKTGQDPTTIEDTMDSGAEASTRHGSVTEEGAIEICLACDSLPSDGMDLPPSPFVVISTILPPQQTWVQHSHTEIVEKSTSPHFLTTIGFGDRQGIDLITRVKLIVYNVKERMSGTMTQLGEVVFTLKDVVLAENSRLHLRLVSQDYRNAGYVTVMSWVNQDCQAEKHGLSRERRPSRRIGMLKSLYDNVITKSFRFETSDGEKLAVYEYLGESKLTIHIPMELLKLWIEEEKEKIELLQELGELVPMWDNRRQEMQDLHTSSQSIYTQCMQYLSCCKDLCFKPSIKKGDKEFEFVPTNLHLQRLWVQNETSGKSGCIDLMTHGTFTAYSQKYRNGGLQRLILVQQENYTPDSSLGGKTKVDHAAEIVSAIKSLKEESLKCCDVLCHAAMQGSEAELRKTLEILTDKVRQLIQVCDDPLLDKANDQYLAAKPENQPSNQQSSRRDLRKSVPANMLRGRNPDLSPEKSWRWSGNEFVKSPTVEPWELTRLNTDAAVVCIQTKVDDILTGKNSPGEQSRWLDELNPAVFKLKSFLEVLTGRAMTAMTFLTLMENRDNIPLMHTIKYRRDIVFSQTLTSLITAFVTMLSKSITDTLFLKQLFQVGILAEFESLVSCHGDEIGMLEDMMVGVQDLTNVTFRLEVAGADTVLPSVIPNRNALIVKVPISRNMMKLLPKELQKGHLIKVTPVLFTVGINEQATLADKFGDTSLQDEVNCNNTKTLQRYYQNYRDIVVNPDVGKPQAGSLEDLGRQLYYNVMTKKRKNVEILWIAAEMCRKLNGLRFICCKSGKDRTSMAVTLEQVQILQQEYDLASHVFTQALDCFRSEGVRRENTFKNTGVRKYAFNSLQLLSFPKLYRPPHGTYGNLQT